MSDSEAKARASAIDLAPMARWLARVGPVAIVDLETTGLPSDPAARILEFAALLLDPGSERIEVIDMLLDPGMPIPPAIQRLTGITDEHGRRSAVARIAARIAARGVCAAERSSRTTPTSSATSCRASSAVNSPATSISIPRISSPSRIRMRRTCVSRPSRASSSAPRSGTARSRTPPTRCA